ncbi:VPS26 [Acrasis kona]|uniref:VPS26 n=1 Tax=Acrasis kona TaxID=1008807 RepID=A0AAW2ZB89_9EUKA
MNIKQYLWPTSPTNVPRIKQYIRLEGVDDRQKKKIPSSYREPFRDPTKTIILQQYIDESFYIFTREDKQIVGHLNIDASVDITLTLTCVVEHLNKKQSVFTVGAHVGGVRFTVDIPENAFDVESYYGKNVRLRYILCLKSKGVILQEQDVIVCNDNPSLFSMDPVRFDLHEVQNSFHISIDLDKTNIKSTGDVLSGGLTFYKFPDLIKFAEVILLRLESTGKNKYTETLSKVEILDGSPSKGEQYTLRFRIVIGPSLQKKLSKTIHISDRLHVTYYADIVIVDVMGRRFYKQFEINIY